MPNGASIAVSNVSKFFGRFPALKNIFLTVNADEPCVVMGPNGCGKSTLLRLIAGLISPDEGFIQLSPELQRARVGYASHEPGLYGPLSVRENIEFFRSILGERRRPIDILDEWSVGEVAEKPVSELSKGQQARVSIARACMGNPDILVLDEPTAFLDDATVDFFCDTMKELRKRSLIIIATHDAARIGTIGDKLVSLKRGILAGVSQEAA